MSGTSDNGLTFGAAIDLSEDARCGRHPTTLGVAILVSCDFGTLDVSATLTVRSTGPCRNRLRRRGVDQTDEPQPAMPASNGNGGLDGH